MQFRFLRFVVLLASTALFSDLAIAGGDTLGNGGGIGELQLTQAWSQLDTKAAVCLENSNPCALSESDRAHLVSVSELRRQQRPGLTFFASKQAQVFTVDTAGNVSFNSTHLYDQNGRVRSFETLFAYVIASFSYQLTRTYDDSLQFGKRVGAFWKQTLFIKEGIVAGKPAVLAVSQVVQPLGTTVNTYVQFRDQAWDLTSDLKGAIPCDFEETSVKFRTGVFGSIGDIMRVTGSLAFNCKGNQKSLQGTYLVEANAGTGLSSIDISNIR